MDPFSKVITDIERDARLVNAIHHAMYALVITNGTTAVDEFGEQYDLDFTPQIDRLRRALQLLGIDTSQPLPAPERDDPMP